MRSDKRREARREERRGSRREERRGSRRDARLAEVNASPKDEQIFVRNDAMDESATPQLEQRKAEKKEYELLKPIRLGKEPIEPAAAGKPPIMVKLRDDQAGRLSKSGHIDLAA